MTCSDCERIIAKGVNSPVRGYRSKGYRSRESCCSSLDGEQVILLKAKTG